MFDSCFTPMRLIVNACWNCSAESSASYPVLLRIFGGGRKNFRSFSSIVPAACGWKSQEVPGHKAAECCSSFARDVCLVRHQALLATWSSALRSNLAPRSLFFRSCRRNAMPVPLGDKEGPCEVISEPQQNPPPSWNKTHFNFAISV